MLPTSCPSDKATDAYALHEYFEYFCVQITRYIRTSGSMTPDKAYLLRKTRLRNIYIYMYIDIYMRVDVWGQANTFGLVPFRTETFRHPTQLLLTGKTHPHKLELINQQNTHRQVNITLLVFITLLLGCLHQIK